MDLEYPIEDARDAVFFKKMTFSKYKLSDVKEKLVKSLVESQMEACCYWTTELVCSGNFLLLWEIILFFFAKYVNVANPKLAVYLEIRFNVFKEATLTCSTELELRNKVVVRQLFAELMCVLCMSPKRLGCDAVKIRKDELTNLQSRMKATNVEYARRFFQDNDALDLYTAVNEIAYSLSSNKVLEACFWIEWFLQYISTKKPTPRIASRPYVKGKSLATDPVWILWDVLLSFAAQKNTLCEKIARSTLRLFSLNYSHGVNDRRKFLFYFLILLICEEIKFDSEMIPEKKTIEAIFPKCSLMYRDIRKNSVRLK